MDADKQPQEDFNAKASPVTGRRLYHCIPVTPEGAQIEPSLNYGTDIPPQVMDKLGIREGERVPLVFASEFLGKALAFGFRGVDNEKLMNGSVEGGDVEYVLVCNRDVTMSKPRSATVFSFTDEGFADLEPAARQSVSRNPVPFGRTQETVKVSNAEDLMRAGLQVFSFKEGIRELHGYHFVYKTMEERGLTFYQFLGEMIKEGRVIWENQARGVNPHPVFKELLADYLPKESAVTSAVRPPSPPAP
jgi:hypothetical protein